MGKTLSITRPMSSLDKYYARLPIWAQHLAVSLYGYYWHFLRFGPGYEQYVQKYKNRENFSISEWQAWQKKRLQELLRIAIDKVPFYQKTWTDAEKEAASRGCLAELPLLNKNVLRISPQDFLNVSLKPKLKLLFHTSGSTGTPIKSFWTTSELRESMALREVRSANWAGVSFKEPRATFSGRLIELNPNSRGPFYRWNLAEHQVYFSAFHLSPDTAHLYIEALKKHKIKWGTGYAVSFYLLAKFALLKKIKVPPLKAIITTSEKLTPEMREVMQQIYQCRIYEEYSTVENSLFASECERGGLHVSPDVAIVEILRPNGEACEPDEVGEVVATCLMHDYQILIRYRLGDMAARSRELCPCGRQMPLLKEVAGRFEDFVIGSDGRQLVRFHGIFVDISNVIEGQVVQDALNDFRVRIVVTNGFGIKEEEIIRKRFQERLGKVNLKIEQVEKLERTERGKFRAVVCNLKKIK